MAIYCPQGSGTLRQQLLMMQGIAWYCMVLHGTARYYMFLQNIAWHYMLLHGIAWYCTVLHGIVHGIANFSPFFTMPENMKGSKSEKLEVVKARCRKARRKELEVGEL